MARRQCSREGHFLGIDPSKYDEKYSLISPSSSFDHLTLSATKKSKLSIQKHFIALKLVQLNFIVLAELRYIEYHGCVKAS